MREVSATELRRFLLERLGLAGPLKSGAALPALAADLAMIQIDSIRVAGLRNHELAWLARGEATVADFYAMVHARGSSRPTIPSSPCAATGCRCSRARCSTSARPPGRAADA